MRLVRQQWKRLMGITENVMKLKTIVYIGFLKTLWFNFRYLPFSEAIHLPVLLARDVKIVHCYRGFCSFMGRVRMGSILFGLGDRIYHSDSSGLIHINGKLILKGDGRHAFGVGTKLNVGKDGVLTIGDNFTASAQNYISCDCAITIGDDNMWSFDNVIMDTDAHQICNVDGCVTNYNKQIIFGNHVWLGCRSIIMKGSEIADGCVIASGSKICGKYDVPNCIITSGKTIIKRNVNWKRDWAINKKDVLWKI
jgi:acetyltransferase-like isoleucine patch superfamily enzyme